MATMRAPAHHLVLMVDEPWFWHPRKPQPVYPYHQSEAHTSGETRPRVFCSPSKVTRSTCKVATFTWYICGLPPRLEVKIMPAPSVVHEGSVSIPKWLVMRVSCRVIIFKT